MILEGNNTKAAESDDILPKLVRSILTGVLSTYSDHVYRYTPVVLILPIYFSSSE